MDPTESILSTLNYTFTNDHLGYNDYGYGYVSNTNSTILSDLFSDDHSLSNDNDLNDLDLLSDLNYNLNNNNSFNYNDSNIDTLLFDSMIQFNDQTSFTNGNSNSIRHSISNDSSSVSNYGNNCEITNSLDTNPTMKTSAAVVDSNQNFIIGCNNKTNPSIFKHQPKKSHTNNNRNRNRNVNFMRNFTQNQSTFSLLNTKSSRLNSNLPQYSNDVSEVALAAAMIANELPSYNQIHQIDHHTHIQPMPKVYVSRKSSKKDVKGANDGVSILVKQQQRRKSIKSNRGPSLLASLTESIDDSSKSLGTESVAMPNEQDSNSNPSLTNLTECASLLDHDYCLNSVTNSNNDNAISIEKSDSNDLNLLKENEMNDILNGFVTDDVVLNELPECLSSLIDGCLNSNDFNDLSIDNSDNILSHLNDACNILTKQYLEDSLSASEDKSNTNPNDVLPELNLKCEEDLNNVIDSCYKSQHHADQVELNVLNDAVNVLNADSSSDSATTTDCESDSLSSKDQRTLMNPPPPSAPVAQQSQFIRTKNLLIKSKRIRSLSSSSTASAMIFTKRKRRFSTRSSVNSSDGSEESSSSTETNSRNSSPERVIDTDTIIENLAINFTPNSHESYFIHSNGFSKNNPANNNKFQSINHQKKKIDRIKSNMDKGKQWTKAYSKNVIKKQLQQHQQQQDSINLNDHFAESNIDKRAPPSTTTTQSKRSIIKNNSDSTHTKLDFRICNNSPLDNFNEINCGLNDDADFDILLRTATEAFD